MAAGYLLISGHDAVEYFDVAEILRINKVNLAHHRKAFDRKEFQFADVFKGLAGGFRKNGNADIFHHEVFYGADGVNLKNHVEGIKEKPLASQRGFEKLAGAGLVAAKDELLLLEL